MKDQYHRFSGERRTSAPSSNVVFLNRKDKMEAPPTNRQQHPADAAIMLLLETLLAAPVCETDAEVVARVKIWLSRFESEGHFPADSLQDLRLDLISELSRADATPEQTIESVRRWVQQAEYATGNAERISKRAGLR